jgi:hypothetical protein
LESGIPLGEGGGVDGEKGKECQRVFSGVKRLGVEQKESVAKTDCCTWRVGVFE